MSETEVDRVETVVSGEDVPVSSRVSRTLEDLNNFVTRGEFWKINPDEFPGIPSYRVFVARYYARENDISGVYSLMMDTPNPKLKRKLAMLVTASVKEAEEELEGSLDVVEDDLDEYLVASRSNLRQGGEMTRMLELAVGLGWVEHLNEKHFPALRALSPDGSEIKKLRMDAMGNRLDSLDAHLGRVRREVGFGALKDPGVEDLRKKLETRMQEVRCAYLALMEDYLVG